MPIDARLLAILVCPACHGSVRAGALGRSLECEGCGRAYPVRDGIPILLVEEATPPDPRKVAKT